MQPKKEILYCLYLRLEKDNEEPTILLLRIDEMAIIAWLASGVVWSYEIGKLIDP